ncbi:unnamed protein product [Vitrella brassicaformis CCMP3155]|uniref:C3H1-type domain-containing protein n=2 Tax=Vitrella brassicaformis TaxID=1169539 RepID=A0A0G4GD65_VITBC|nr:unnamed protein product [Vitrella brassicaformis CCMP3155]|mmetsp:Transcript_22974/g.56789  ORF Transcript_22974/g.56789 Transcript_22974/m.56789 type:complete len:497 (+) Transcript_22974:305-1795(+)|eukprot:CEM27200.1 unnamed protein product [Vitrella brassicaformis CCMP3155]
MSRTQYLSDENLRTFRTSKCQRLVEGRCDFGADRCPYSHNTEWTRRRVFYHNSKDAIKYCHLKCPDVQIDFENESIRSNTCKMGDKCPYSHSAEEIFYHPLFYKTRECPSYQRMSSCPRYYCPFIHSRAEDRTHHPDRQYKMYQKYHRNDGIELPPIEGVILVEGPPNSSNRQLPPMPQPAATRPNVPQPPVQVPTAPPQQPNDQLTKILTALRSLPESERAHFLQSLPNVGQLLCQEEATRASAVVGSAYTSSHASPTTPMSLPDNELAPLASTSRPNLVISNSEDATAALHALLHYYTQADDQTTKALQPAILETALPIVLHSLRKHPVPQADRTSSQSGSTPSLPPAPLSSPPHHLNMPGLYDEANSGHVQMGMGRGMGFTIGGGGWDADGGDGCRRLVQRYSPHKGSDSDLSTVMQGASSSWSRSGSSAWSKSPKREDPPPSFYSHFPQASADAAHGHRQATPTPYTTLTDRERLALPRGLLDDHEGQEGGL